MKIYCWNVNGIRAASQKGYTEWFKNSKPDILCLQETKAQVEQVDEQIGQPKGYHSYKIRISFSA